MCMVPEVYPKMENVPQTLSRHRVPLGCSSSFTFSQLTMGAPSVGELRHCSFIPTLSTHAENWSRNVSPSKIC